MPSQRRPKRPISFADLMSIDRIGQPTVSPDGRRFAFTVSRPDHLKNRTCHTITVFDMISRDITELTPGSGNHSRPAWSPDGKWIAFVSQRDRDEGEQIYLLPVGGGEARKITYGYGGAGTPVWAPDSKRILFSRSVVVSPYYTPKKSGKLRRGHTAPSRAEIHGLINPASSARTADNLLFRHWDSWRDRKRNHLFVVDCKSGRMNDVTPHPCDAPPISLGSECDYQFSPDGREIAFVMNPDEVVARSTNNSIFTQELKGIGRVGEPVSISTSEANDCHPRYLPDGNSIAYLAMMEPGYEADRPRIKVYNRKSGETDCLLKRFDRGPAAFEVTPQQDIIFSADDRGRRTLYRLNLSTGRVKQLTSGTYNGLFRCIPGSNDLLVTRETTTTPADFHLLKPSGGVKPLLSPGPAETERPDGGSCAEKLTGYGEAIAHVEMNEAEEFWYDGAGGTPVHGFLVRPPRFRKGRKYPLILLIHGGPQGAFSDHFHYRWNSQYFAREGAVVAFLNPRGSTGYGQKFTDQISKDWGGRCFDDIMLGFDHIVKKYRFVDRKRVAAAGASFGGFMVNWIAGHTDRFRALVCHDGIFHAETMAYTTEELWFEEKEHGRLPYSSRSKVVEFSPHMHVKNFKTPTLVVHGGQDFRCPMSEGLGMFTALQVMNVPSRFLHFPDEGHWVLQPANSEVWYDEVLGWMMKYLKE